jgi:hypothetical protein
MPADPAWPPLPFAALQPTAQTLQLWTQIVGKVRLASTPWLNHSWHVSLSVSARGLRTPLIPHPGGGFDIEFDFMAAALVIRVVGGGERRVPLEAGAVADFYGQAMDALAALGVPVRIDTRPNEMAEAVPFPRDRRPRPYDGAIAQDLWRALAQIDRVLGRFRSGFLGKCSPVHLFWGSFDMAVTRFSGRPAPLHPGGIPHLPDAVTREAYSHEVSSAGFWPGGAGGVDEPAFYSYAYPSPPGFAQAPVTPAAARFVPELGEFVLPYEAVRTSGDPDGALMAFLHSTYAAAADLGGWDRAALECDDGRIGAPRLVG